MGQKSLCRRPNSSHKIRDMLRGRLGEDTYTSWFRSLEIVRKSGSTLHVSVPTQFLKKWFQQHFSDVLMQSAARELGPIDRLDIALRVPMAAQPKPTGRDADEHQPLAISTDEGRPHAITSILAVAGSEPCRFQTSCARRPTASRARRSIRAARSRISSSAPRTAWPMPQPCRWLRPCSRRRAASIRCSCTPTSASARATCCTPSPGKCSGACRRPKCSI